MLFSIQHKITFQYSKPVFLDPIVLRLKPRTDSNQKLLHYRLKISPQPQGKSEVVDWEGCSSEHLWFSEKHTQLVLEAESETQTRRSNPFDFILTDPCSFELPMTYPARWKSFLSSYRKPRFPSPKIKAFSEKVSAMAKKGSLDFLMTLATVLSEQFQKGKREYGPPLKPTEVLKIEKGSCRDLTLLYMEVCRNLGFAARFVSGYCRGDDQLTEKELHAWAEIYLPGGGWRGFDPSLGLAVSDQHIALSAHPESEFTLPTEGSFRGAGVESKMDYQVLMQVQEENSEAVNF